ncbi:MAG: T9SS type A sorting domain-containing protein [Saprospiraceae bacterium]|nr:T9SS type A sorting domain-containing protein [Saprospiraceae bacterium]
MKFIYSFMSKQFIQVIFILLSAMATQAQIHYVHPSAAGSGDGSSWVNAYTNLQVAIDAATPGDSIFVATGIYLPTYRHLGDSLRNSTFYLNKILHLFGGFSGEAGTEGGLVGRDLNLYPTILSGDVGTVDDAADNSFHVLYLDHVSDLTWIDGFTIENGNGVGGAGYEALGAGIFNDAKAGLSSPTIANCIIRDNRSAESGGGMASQAENGGHASPTLLYCSFISNLASGGGGVSFYTDTEGETNPVMVGCRFLGNSGPTAGGGALQFIAHSSASNPKLINCIVTGNHSPTSAAMAGIASGTGILKVEVINSAFSGNTGGTIRVVDFGMQSSTITVRNSILWGNGGSQAPTTNGATVDAAFSIIPFGFPGEGVIGIDPMYVNQPPLLDTAHVLGDLHLQEGSPAFDAGRNSDVPLFVNKDADNNRRFVNASNGQNGIVDIGPYEFQPNITSTDQYLAESAWSVYPSPVTTEATISFEEITTAAQFQLMDLQGRVLIGKKLGKGQDHYTFTVEGLPAGTYLVCFYHDGKNGVKKISVQ